MFGGLEPANHSYRSILFHYFSQAQDGKTRQAIPSTRKDPEKLNVERPPGKESKAGAQCESYPKLSYQTGAAERAATSDRWLPRGLG